MPTHLSIHLCLSCLYSHVLTLSCLHNRTIGQCTLPPLPYNHLHLPSLHSPPLSPPAPQPQPDITQSSHNYPLRGGQVPSQPIPLQIPQQASGQLPSVCCSQVSGSLTVPVSDTEYCLGQPVCLSANICDYFNLFRILTTQVPIYLCFFSGGNIPWIGYYILFFWDTISTPPHELL